MGQIEVDASKEEEDWSRDQGILGAVAIRFAPALDKSPTSSGSSLAHLDFIMRIVAFHEKTAP